MAEMVEEHAHQVYIKDVKFYSTIVTAASEEDAKWKALREHTTLEGYEHQESSLKFMDGDFFWANVAGRGFRFARAERLELLVAQPREVALQGSVFAQLAQLLFHLALSLSASCVAQRISADLTNL